MNFITDFNGGEKVQRPDFACMAVLQTLAIYNNYEPGSIYNLAWQSL